MLQASKIVVYNFSIYFMYAIASIILFNLLVLAFIVWKFGIDVFFDKDEETTKDIPLERTQ